MHGRTRRTLLLVGGTTLGLGLMGAVAVRLWGLPQGRPEDGVHGAARPAPPDAFGGYLSASGPTLAGRGTARAGRSGPEPVAPPATTPADAVRSLPLTIETVDAETGWRLEVSWWLGATPPAQWTTLPTIGARRVPLTEVTRFARWFRTEVPAGLANWEDRRIEVTVARRATALRHVHPLRREVTAHVTVLRSDGSPAREASLQASVGEKQVEIRWNASQGAGPVAGLPFLRGALVEWTAREPYVSEDGQELERVAERPVRFGSDPRQVLAVQLLLPAAGAESIQIIGTGGGSAFRGRGTFRRREQAPTGRLEVTLLGRDGKPLAEALVRLVQPALSAVTDRDGRAVFVDVPAGTVEVRSAELGVVATWATAEVVGGQTARAILREGRGGTVDIEVVDEDGAGLPFATLELGESAGQPWCDLSDDGVQRTDPYTDAQGRRELLRVSPGFASVGATFGERRAGPERIEVVEGARTTLRLVAR